MSEKIGWWKYDERLKSKTYPAVQFFFEEPTDLNEGEIITFSEILISIFLRFVSIHRENRISLV
jgi:hypothetical protein